MLTDTLAASTPADHRDRTAYLCLFAAGVLFAFTAGRWAFAPAAWLAPMFLLRFLRSRPVVPGLFIAWLVRYLVAAVVTLPGTVAVTGVRYYLSVLVIITAAMLPYAADRLLAPRLPGLAATLVFPAALVSLEYLTSFGPTGTINSLANSQYGDLPLMQLASVTGIWGITFLIGWFASVVNWAWERGFVWPRIRTGTVLYGAVLLVVFLGRRGAAGCDLTRAGHRPRRRRSAPRSGRPRRRAACYPPHRRCARSRHRHGGPKAAARSAFTGLDDDLLAATADRRRPARRSSPGPRRPLSVPACWTKTNRRSCSRPPPWPGNTTSTSNSDSACSCPARPGRPT